ncbi:MAG: dihydroneopterin aldolase [Aphanocapsa feldmannii 277cV]|uniref:dihydroneopterin aldolase n=2 Tax=Aphanocapsa feldmannii TaxID=192050 RepID=A0A524RQN9_9CHRO|nr:MAG: dihydroneopterin aldolase [Aphanocapsa feldmannii 288cV]TGG94828.1 MAG: dihydroneopterin aldolase [Aphanocapsa feldmannii 277cV]TGH27524.1 MAG: dihydroneopterin aldolase [Aphanocapsa feldmannii 277cI]
MSGYDPRRHGGDAVHVKGLRLWARIGVLPPERELGQWFELEYSLWRELGSAAAEDDITQTADYGLAISRLQVLVQTFSCHTIERFAEVVLDLLTELYGPLPMRVLVLKCQAPLPGFAGTVAVERWR